MKADFEEIKVPLHDDLDTKPGIDWANTEIAQIEPRKTPRIPRDTEPCHLWEFGLISGLVLVALGAAGAGLIYGLGLTLEAFDSYATAFLRSLVRWVQ